MSDATERMKREAQAMLDVAAALEAIEDEAMQLRIIRAAAVLLDVDLAELETRRRIKRRLEEQE